MGALDGKVAVVTGSTSGSGRGIAKRFVEEGAHVVMLARGPGTPGRSSRPSSVTTPFPSPTDVGDPDSVRAAFSEIEERFGKLDILINNAAIYRPCVVELLSDSDIMKQVSTNFLGPVYTSRAAIPLHARRRRRRHRQHVERVHARPVPHALDVRRHQGGARDVRPDPGRGAARRGDPGDHAGPGNRVRYRRRVHRLGVGAGARGRRGRAVGEAGVVEPRGRSRRRPSRSKTSPTCTSSSSPARAPRSSTPSTAAASRPIRSRGRRRRPARRCCAAWRTSWHRSPA